LGDVKDQGRKKNRVITRDIGVRIRQKAAEILVADFGIDEEFLRPIEPVKWPQIPPFPDHKGQLRDLIKLIKISQSWSDVSIVGLEGRASDTGPHKNNQGEIVDLDQLRTSVIRALDIISSRLDNIRYREVKNTIENTINILQLEWFFG
jgi:hypothetical protein